MAFFAASMTFASTIPPPMVPDIRPSFPTAIFAPFSPGVEPSASTIVTNAITSPLSTLFIASFKTSNIPFPSFGKIPFQHRYTYINITTCKKNTFL